MLAPARTLQRRPGSGVAEEAGLQLHPALPYEAWVTIGRRLARLSGATAWSLGDWLLFGQRTYHGRYRHALEMTDLSYQTLRNYAWVASRFELSRRRDGLSFQHHAEVAPLPQAQQDLWLQRAQGGAWSRNELRRRLAAHRDAAKRRNVVQVIVRVALSAEAEQRWKRAAASADQELPDWLCAVAEAAAAATLPAT